MPLNSELYQRLRKVFGKVDIANEGEPVRELVLNTGLGRAQTKVEDGEYYKVSCPFCDDTRQRLWISYKYSDKPWLTVCYNETACMTGVSGACNRPLLRNMILYAPICTVPNFASHEPTKDIDPDKIETVLPPGPLVPADQLPENHQVRRYLASRKFDVSSLVKDYGVSLITGSERFPWIAGRIYFPIVMNGRVVGWQVRYPEDTDYKAIGATKYYNLPDMPKRSMLYGFDRAKEWSFVVLTEGATDVWAVGPPAVSVFGSSVTSTQRRLLIENWSTIFFYFDADTVDKKKDGESVQQREIDKILPYLGSHQKLVPIALPTGVDPGSLSRYENRFLIRRAAELAGVPIDMSWS